MSNKDRTVTVALIGFAGTVLAALITAFHPFPPLPTPDPTPTVVATGIATQTPVSPLATSTPVLPRDWTGAISTLGMVRAVFLSLEQHGNYLHATITSGDFSETFSLDGTLHGNELYFSGPDAGGGCTATIDLTASGSGAPETLNGSWQQQGLSCAALSGDISLSRQ
jgi:hypothetical protein